MTIHQLSIDLKAEVVLWALTEAGMAMDDMVVQPVGTFRRAFSRDVRAIEKRESPSGKSQWHVELNRDGLYDALPEGLFHQPTTRKPNRTAEEIIEEINKQQAKEAAARRFFLPIEQEFYRQRVQLTQEGQRYHLTPGNALTNQALIDFWEIPDFFDARQTFCLFHLLPLAHRIAGDYALTAQYMGLLTGNNITLRTTYVTSHVMDDRLLPRLGNAQMGVDCIIGDCYPEHVAVTQLTVLLDNPEHLPDYLPGGKQLPVIQYLADYLLPVEADWQLSIDFSPTYQEFVLTSDEHTSRLGYTSFINT